MVHRLNRLLSVLVSVVALAIPSQLLATETMPPGGTFVDDDGNVHEGYVEAIAAEGITRGCDPPMNIHFCPARSVTRGEMAAFLVRAFELEGTDTDSFWDDNGSVFEGEINALAAAGITKGCNPPANTEFCPARGATRGEMAAFLVRAFELEGTDTDFFWDDNGSVFEGEINALAAAGIAKGCNPPANSQYCPSRTVTRAEMASFLGRALQLTPATPAPRRALLPGVLWSVDLTVPDRPNEMFGPSEAVFYDQGVVIVDHQEWDTDDVTFIDRLVYAFEPSGGRWVPTLLEPDNPPAAEGFPVDVAASGSRVAITATSDDDRAVYVFTRTGTGWSQTRLALPYDGDFDGAVAMDGDRIAVRWDATRFVIIDWNGSRWVPSIHAVDPEGREVKSGGIDVDGEIVALASPDSSTTALVGAVYVAREDHGEWGSVRLETVGEAHSFGSSVDVDGDRVLVGANGASPGPGGPGGLYLYTWNGSMWSGEIVAEDFGGFGDWAHLDGDVILCSGQDWLSFWVFEQVEGDWNGNEVVAGLERVSNLAMQGRLGAVVDGGSFHHNGVVILFEVPAL